MALEKDFELLDDYLAGRMDATERQAFQNKLNADPQLKGEFELQQQLVEGVKKARVLELKSMMNNIPVPALHGTETATVISKIALWTVVAGLVATGVFLYVKSDDNKTSEDAKVVQPSHQKEEVKNEEQPATTEQQEEPQREEAPVVSDEPSTHENKPLKSPTAPPKKKSESVSSEPAIEVYDPTTETEELSIALEEGKTPTLSKTPSIAVEVDSENKKYDFHYQFKDNKLTLFGPFEKNVYEIMEFFNQEKRTMFLFYRENFYLLKDDSEKMKPLGLVQDPALIKKLREYRRN
jgi:hypothetical protein